MATRSPGQSSRSKKASGRALPPVTTVTEEEKSTVDADADAVDSLAGDGVVGEASPSNQAASQEVTITHTNLHREIPSFSESREARIAESAYWRAERRGFAPGHELEDWLHAENEVDQSK
jgi:hypothetical protein